MKNFKVLDNKGKLLFTVRCQKFVFDPDASHILFVNEDGKELTACAPFGSIVVETA